MCLYVAMYVRIGTYCHVSKCGYVRTHWYILPCVYMWLCTYALVQINMCLSVTMYVRIGTDYHVSICDYVRTH